MRIGFLFRIAALLAGSAAITGCAAMPEIGPHLELRAADSLGSSVVTDGPAAPWPGETWWQGYGDAQLSALIEEALAGSPTLAMADARVRKAAAFAQSAGAAQLPTLSAGGNVAALKQSYNNGIPPQFVPKGYNDTGRAALDLSYEIDFFGRNSAALRAALQREEARRALAALGLEPVGEGLDDFARRLEREGRLWAEAGARLGLGG